MDRAFAWASSKTLVRKNSVHGEEEARLVLTDDFSVRNEEAQQTEQAMQFEVTEAGFFNLSYVFFEYQSHTYRITTKIPNHPQLSKKMTYLQHVLIPQLPRMKMAPCWKTLSPMPVTTLRAS